MELATAVDQGLPILIVLWNDESFGEIRRDLPEFGTSVPRPDFGHLCAAYGIPHVLAEDSLGVRDTLESNSDVLRVLRGEGGPVMLEIQRPWDGPVKTKTSPNLVLGTMTFGWDQASSLVDDAVASKMIQTFVDAGGVEVDTARMYSNGKTEKMIGRVVMGIPTDARAVIRVSTKANPAGEAGDTSMGGLGVANLQGQFTRSLEALGTSSCDIFYLHWPDNETHLEETLREVQRSYEQNMFVRFGLSNYTPEEVAEIHCHMRERGWVLPTVYQGMYNAVTRNVEKDLLPLLRELDMGFYAFNPLAGGMLTGKHAFDMGANTADGRFKGNDWYQDRFWKEGYFRALQNVQEGCEAQGIPMKNAALRWLSYHSALDGRQGDAVIIGCSSLDQLTENLEAFCEKENGKGRLPVSLVDLWNDAWASVEGISPHFAPYGTSKPPLCNYSHAQQSSSVGLPYARTYSSVASSFKRKPPSRYAGRCFSSLSSPVSHSGNAKITNAAVTEDGKQVEVRFHDGSVYRFHASWLLDSSPSQFNESYVRRSARGVAEVAEGGVRALVTCISGEDSGDTVRVELTRERDNGTTGAESHEFSGVWLHAFAPYVGQFVRHSSQQGGAIGGGDKKRNKDQDHLLSDLTISYNEPWGADKTIRSFSADDLYGIHSTQAQFLETMAIEGVARIDGLKAPLSYDTNAVGDHLEDLVNRAVGKMYQHPRRKSRYGVMREKMATAAAPHLSDYNFDNALSMHTDHAFIDGVQGYFQFMLQAQGSVRSKVCNGLAVAAYIRDTDPRSFELLSSTNVTHSLRTLHYDVNGDYCHISGFHDGVFEDTHTHPIIQMDDEGHVVKVSHAEIKRGICAIPFEDYEDFMVAYSKWMDLIEDDRFVCHFDWPENSVIVTNNWYVLHGRATKPVDKERIMVWGYIQKHIADLRYRLLKQRELETKTGLSSDWTTRIPNHVLKSMISIDPSARDYLNQPRN
uniref:TauD/TfdA-like domain-containing protein n=1 Tax=Octactis speculum TaxID=3111310 RepID=A0A7S2GXY1_9STRA